MSDGAGTWTFRNDSLVRIERRRLEDDEDLAPDAAIVGAFIEDRLIARSIAEADWTTEQDHALFHTPRQIQYTATEGEDRVIRAELFAVIPTADLPREPWQPEPEVDTPEGLILLGIVVRLANERTQADLPSECVDHFMRIMNLGAEPVVDRLLRSV